MRAPGISIVLLLAAVACAPAAADEAALQQRIIELEQRVAKLERRLEEISSDARWRDPILWRRIKKGMDGDQVKRLLGQPARIEERVFTTWYYHPTAKAHSFVWFDEGKVLGWTGPGR